MLSAADNMHIHSERCSSFQSLVGSSGEQGGITMEITGAELFIKTLKEEVVTTLFAYPGGKTILLLISFYSPV